MSAFVTREAPDFTATAVVNEEFKDSQAVRLPRQVRRAVLLPARLHLRLPDGDHRVLRQDRGVPQARSRSARLSIDSQFTHLAWIRRRGPKAGSAGSSTRSSPTSTRRSAPTTACCSDGGDRAARHVPDRQEGGIVRHAHVNDLPLGRNIDEALRMLDALQHFEKHGEVCPANWKPGAMTIDTKNASKYFKAANAK